MFGVDSNPKQKLMQFAPTYKVSSPFAIQHIHGLARAAAKRALAPVVAAVAVYMALMSVATTASAQSKARIQNVWKTDQFIHAENTQVQAGTIKPGWESAMWVMEPVAGEPNYRRLRNVWKADEYLHVENEKLQVGPIQPGWESAMWAIEPVKGSTSVRIRNRWLDTNYLNIEHGRLESGAIGDGWLSAMWRMVPIQ
jgi:hypothetical protein